MSDTIVELRQLSEDEQERAEAYYREKRQHDEASALGRAWREGFILSYAKRMAAERNALIEEMLKNGSTEEDINKVKAAFEEHDAAFAREAYAKSEFKQKLLEKYRAENECE